MKILLIDIETTPNLAHVWGLWQQNVGLSQLLESTEMMCFAAKFVGDKRTQFYSTFWDGKETMVQKAWDLLNEADVVVGWNSRSFDEKHLNREFLQAGLTPPSPYKSLDLMLAVKKKFRLPSNKLQYVSKMLGLAGKVQHSGHELWIQCMAGLEKAWRQMKKYNIQDVDLLEDVYWAILPWIDGHPAVALYDGLGEDSCPNCGGTNLAREGYAHTKQSVFQRYQCRDCGKWSRSTHAIARVSVVEMAA